MATNEQLIPIPGRLHSLASEGHVAGADEIYDDTQGKLQSTINTEKADKSATVSGVSYDTTNKKIQQTINGTTTDVVSVSTLKTDMSLQKSDVGLGNVENKSSATIRGELTSSDVTTALGYTPPQQDTTYSVMGASGSTHASGLVPDTPTTAGTTKFLREDGTWNEPAGSSYTAGDGIDISNNEISVDSTVALKTDLANEKQGNGIGTCSTSSGTALAVSLTNYELVTNGFVAVTFENDVPAGATLNINSKGAKPIIYKGAAITADTIKADDTALFSYDGTNYVLVSSGGSGSIPQEELTISLASNQTADTGLNGATITVTQTGVVEPLYSGTWAGTNIVINIDDGTEYTITVGSVTGYSTPSAQTFVAIGNNSRTATFTYNTEVITVTATTSNSAAVTGQKVTINGTEYTFDSTGIVSAKVPFGTSYSVVASSWSGTTTGGAYKKPSSQSFTAGQVSRSVSVIWTWIADSIDLGLPSGILWCNKNIGATNPEDAGYFFSYGNIVGHNLNAPATGEYSFDSTNYANTQGAALTASFSSGDTTYDAAAAILGGGARMPTYSETTELINNTDKESVTVNNVSCVKFMKKTDHTVYILIPICGRYHGGTSLSALTSIRTTECGGNYAYSMNVGSQSPYARLDNWDKFVGYNVRAIY